MWRHDGRTASGALQPDNVWLKAEVLINDTRPTRMLIYCRADVTCVCSPAFLPTPSCCLCLSCLPRPRPALTLHIFLNVDSLATHCTNQSVHLTRSTCNVWRVRFIVAEPAWRTPFWINECKQLCTLSMYVRSRLVALLTPAITSIERQSMLEGLALGRDHVFLSNVSDRYVEVLD